MSIVLFEWPGQWNQRYACCDFAQQTGTITVLIYSTKTKIKITSFTFCFVTWGNKHVNKNTLVSLTVLTESEHERDFTVIRKRKVKKRNSQDNILKDD